MFCNLSKAGANAIDADFSSLRLLQKVPVNALTSDLSEDLYFARVLSPAPAGSTNLASVIRHFGTALGPSKERAWGICRA